MSAGTYNFTIEQGATFQRDFVYTDFTGAAVNLAGYSARMQVRPTKESSTILIEATTANGKLVITPAQGKISLTIPASETDAAGFDVGVYDLEVESASGIVTRLVEGSVMFSKQVTR